METAAGQTVARGRLAAGARGLTVRVRAQNMEPGRYAIHLHAVGRCAAPGFESAGTHWNPAGRTHGFANGGGPHLGDLPNLDIAASGRGRIDHYVEGGFLGGADGLLDADGAALVIHAMPDDNRTDPTGNSGARIACGIVRAR